MKNDRTVVPFPQLQSSGGPPHNGEMEARVTKLEDLAQKANDRLGGIDVRLAHIEAKLDTFATKADLQEMSGSVIKWMVGTAVGLGAAAITVMTFVLNNAAPKAPPTPPAQAPIIINVPAAATAQPPAATP